MLSHQDAGAGSLRSANLAGYVRMVDIADATSIALRSLQRWKKRVEQELFDPEEDAPCFIVAELAEHDSQEQEQETSCGEAVGQSVGASEEVEIRCEQPLNDPLNRGLYRVLARLVMIEDADPLFAPGQRLDGMVFFMVMALLGSHPLLRIFENTYGKALAPAFYGLRSTALTLLMMVLLRIKRPEQLRHHNPANQGRVLGLDRVIEVKTLRRKLHRLADLNRGTELMEELGRARGSKVSPRLSRANCSRCWERTIRIETKKGVCQEF